MPYIGGKRVTLEEWRAHNPVKPLYLRDEFGRRTTVYEGEEADAIPNGPEAIAVRSSRLERDRRAAVANALGISPAEVTADVSAQYLGPVTVVGPSDWATPPWLRDVDPDELDDDDDPNRTELRPSDWSPRLTGATESPDEAPSGPVGSSNPSEDGATRFAASKGLPKHRPDRPSQLAEASRERKRRSRANQKRLQAAQQESES